MNQLDPTKDRNWEFFIRHRERRNLFTVTNEEATDPTRFVTLQRHLGYEIVNEMINWVEDNYGRNTHFFWGDRLYFVNDKIGVVFKLTWFDHVI